MLFVSSNIQKYHEFREIFRKNHDGVEFLDLSKVQSSRLVNEVESIVSHHSNYCIFLGYLEPGWMLELTHQTRIRKLFRKFPVAFVSNFIESIPFSWKNEIDTFYTDIPVNKNGNSNSLNNGSSLQDESKL
jgi:DNA polymerase elongation subunit (family B)